MSALTEDIQKLKLVNDSDPSGIPWDWHIVRDLMMKYGVQSLPAVFAYYQEFNPHFDPWCNYLLSISYFTEEELNFPTNRSMRRNLELKVRKLMKKHKKDDITVNEFLNMYKNELSS